MDSHAFWLALDADLAEVARTLRPVRVTIGAISNGLATVQTGEMSGPTAESYARILSGVQINPGDDAWALFLDPGYLILGKNQNSAQNQVTFELPISVPNGVSSFSGGLVGETIISNVSADAADTASTTAISTFQQASLRTVTLPTGTWNFWVNAWLALKNSGGNNGQLRVQIDGNAGGTRTVALNSSTYQTAMCHATQGGVTGGRSVNVLLEYHGTTSGTTSAQNPALLIFAFRAS